MTEGQSQPAPGSSPSSSHDSNAPTADVIERNLKSFIQALSQIQNWHTEHRGVSPEAWAVQAAVCDAMSVADPTELVRRSWTSDQIVDLIGDDQLPSPPEPAIQSISPGKPLLPQHVSRLLTEQRIKYDSELWTIHLSDVDPFPSSPHAHCLGSAVKMDLGTGFLYERKRRVGSLHWKDFLEFRDLVKYRPLPELDRAAR